MNVLLAIISCPKDNELIERHWPYFKMLHWPILGCGSNDGRCEWPEPMLRLDTGKPGKINTPAGSSIYGLVEQELDILRFFLEETTYDSVCIVEGDNLFVRQPPKHQGGYMITLLPNHERPGLYRTSFYFSTPRWPDRETAQRLYACGMKMFHQGETEFCMSDRFPAWVCQKHRIQYRAQNAWSPSVYANSNELWLSEARTAIKQGAFCLHSVKTKEQLDALKDLLPKV